jgi:hypothetical protein
MDCRRIAMSSRLWQTGCSRRSLDSVVAVHASVEAASQAFGTRIGETASGVDGLSGVLVT